MKIVHDISLKLTNPFWETACNTLAAKYPHLIDIPKNESVGFQKYFNNSLEIPLIKNMDPGEGINTNYYLLKILSRDLYYPLKNNSILEVITPEVCIDKFNAVNNLYINIKNNNKFDIITEYRSRLANKYQMEYLEDSLLPITNLKLEGLDDSIKKHIKRIFKTENLKFFDIKAFILRCDSEVI